MPYYKDWVYPYLVDKLGDPPPIRRIRRQIIPLAWGNVLEIGAGSGANFPHYDATKVPKLYALEPNLGMIRLAQRKQLRTKLNITYLDLPGERIPLDDRAIDTVVSTFTLGTIDRVEEAMKEIARVLKLGGSLLFFELGRSPDPVIEYRQEQLEPFYHWLFQGLHLTRDIPSLIVKGGFQITRLEEGYLARFPRSLSYCWWGCATLPLPAS